MNDFLTISEFATASGVTSQAIYKRLQKDLKAFVKVENGKKYINKDGLKLFNKTEKDNPVNNELQKVIELLQEQLKAKDEQIAGLQRALEIQQQLNAATLQSFKALPAEDNTEEHTQQQKKHWWKRNK